MFNGAMKNIFIGFDNDQQINASTILPNPELRLWISDIRFLSKVLISDFRLFSLQTSDFGHSISEISEFGVLCPTIDVKFSHFR